MTANSVPRKQKKNFSSEKFDSKIVFYRSFWKLRLTLKSSHKQGQVGNLRKWTCRLNCSSDSEVQSLEREVVEDSSWVV